MTEITHVVGPEHTARAVGSGDLEVLGTPVLLAWCEEATCAALDLPAEQTSVGTRVEIAHTAASAVGAEITAKAQVVHTDGRLVRFEVVALDGGRTVGHGEITRVVVDRERFLARLADVRP